ncbi:putative retrotransposon gag domain-containing protein [Helianthus annuus]|nr:putative retrotransposon gag domain-containing protein [Helianthus annuus]
MFLDSKPGRFTGAEGPIGLIRWIEKSESVFAMCNCADGNRVKYAASTLEDGALTGWNAQVQARGLAAANATTWTTFKALIKEEYCPLDRVQQLEQSLWNRKMVGSEIEAYTSKHHDLVFLCPDMARPVSKQIELYIGGLVPEIRVW